VREFSKHEPPENKFEGELRRQPAGPDHEDRLREKCHSDEPGRLVGGRALTDVQESGIRVEGMFERWLVAVWVVAIRWFGS
jgi:hypothetical protein